MYDTMRSLQALFSHELQHLYTLQLVSEFGKHAQAWTT